MVVVLASSASVRIQATPATVAECPAGFGSETMVRLLPSQINDGYCDCPTTGQDEPKTQACSGQDAWPGQPYEPDSTKSHRDPLVFVCPNQSNLSIPPSRVDDGICDCCDGADERPGTCEDNCESLRQAERQVRQVWQDAYTAGSSRRAMELTTFANVRAETLHNLTLAESDVYFLEQEQSQTQQELEEAKIKAWKSRQHVHSLALANLLTAEPGAPFRGMLSVLTKSELIWFITHACQLAGEILDTTESVDGGKTCVPLRLAGLDASLLWQSKTYDLERILDANQGDTDESDQAQNEQWSLLVELLEYNMANEPKIWNQSTLQQMQKTRRRLMEEDADYDSMDYHDDYLGADDDYDYAGDDLDYDYAETETTDDLPAPDDAPTDGKREELMSLIRSQPFSHGRVTFFDESSSLLEKIKAITDAEEQDDKEVDEEVSDSVPPSLDPMALPMVRSQLEQRQRRVQRGFSFAVSAQALLEGLERYAYASEEDEVLDLYSLAMGVINHGQLSTTHVWQILLGIIPELVVENAMQTCVSALASSCPPRSVYRSIGEASVPIPAPLLLEAGEAFCTMHATPNEMEDVCVDSSIGTTDIPSSVPDGLLGYFETKPRDDSDAFSHLFMNLSLNGGTETWKKIEALQERLRKTQEDKKDTEARMGNMEDSIGGKDGPGTTLGVDGELFALKDQCFNVEAGKYIYEICIFGSAAQKEKTGGSTSLGEWIGVDIEAETGRRVWKWGNGAKCWNGPQRSVTAFVTCGSETKVLSAGEPDTCRYEVEVESHIACDESYRMRYGLE
jgi:hypothetical protein